MRLRSWAVGQAGRWRILVALQIGDLVWSCGKRSMAAISEWASVRDASRAARFLDGHFSDCCGSDLCVGENAAPSGPRAAPSAAPVSRRGSARHASSGSPAGPRGRGPRSRDPSAGRRGRSPGRPWRSAIPKNCDSHTSKLHVRKVLIIRPAPSTTRYRPRRGDLA